MAKIDDLIEAFHENINNAEGIDGKYLLPQFEEIKNLYYGIEEVQEKEISEEDKEREEESLKKYYSEPGYKGD